MSIFQKYPKFSKEINFQRKLIFISDDFIFWIFRFKLYIPINLIQCIYGSLRKSIPIITIFLLIILNRMLLNKRHKLFTLNL